MPGLTTTEKEFWKTRIAARIGERIEAIHARRPAPFDRSRREAHALALRSLGLAEAYAELEAVKAEVEALDRRRKSAKRAMLARLRGVPLEDVADGVHLGYGGELPHEAAEAVRKRQALHEAESLADDPIGREIARREVERENLLDAVRPAVSPTRIKQPWTKVGALLGDEPTGLEREALAIEPADVRPSIDLRPTPDLPTPNPGERHGKRPDQAERRLFQRLPRRRGRLRRNRRELARLPGDAGRRDRLRRLRRRHPPQARPPLTAAAPARASPPPGPRRGRVDDPRPSRGRLREAFFLAVGRRGRSSDLADRPGLLGNPPNPTDVAERTTARSFNVNRRPPSSRRDPRRTPRKRLGVVAAPRRPADRRRSRRNGDRSARGPPRLGLPGPPGPLRGSPGLVVRMLDVRHRNG